MTPDPTAHERATDARTDARTEDLRRRLDAVHHRIEDASVAAGRVDRPQLLVVTKFFPAADVRRLVSLGVRDVGENRDQEASAKAAEIAGSDAVADGAGAGRDAVAAQLRWHFIGQLQSNKAKSVVRYAASVHSVDRVSLVRALARAVADHRPPHLGSLPCFVQVDLDPSSTGRGGVQPADVMAVAEAVAAAEGLDLAGVMAVAPRSADPEEAFARLARISVDVRAEHPGATGISAGMSGDLEPAIAHGATHLRVGSDVLGPRPAVR